MRPSRFADAWHLVAIAGALATIAALGTRPLVHDDLFYHLRTGEMVARTGVVPTSDSFTHTLPGTPWTTHEWGFGLLLYGVYRLGGFDALVGLMPAVLVCIFLALYLRMRRAIAPERLALAAPLLLLGLGAAERSCFVLRAALFTTLGLALLVHLLHRLHTGGGVRVIAAIAVLFLVWANMHAGVVFGVAVVGLHALQSALDAWRSTEAQAKGRWAAVLRGRSRDRALLVLACAAITLVNPNGFDVWTFPLRLNRLLYASGLTYDMGIFAAPVPARHPWFFVLVAAVLLACVPWSRARRILRDPTQPALAHALGTAFFLVMGLRSNRFILDFVVFALPFCATIWGAHGRETLGAQEAAARQGWVARAIRQRTWLEVGGVATTLGVLVATQPALPRHALAAHVPVRLADFMAREGIAGRMFNPESFGGYLGWRLRQPVFWDGRNDIFGPLAIDFAHAHDFGELATRYALDVAVMEPGYDKKFERYFLSHRGDWGLVYWDRTASLYLKRIPRFQRTLARWEYQLLRPFAVPADAELARLVTDAALRARVEVELANALSQSDDSFIAWYLRGRIAQERGDYPTAYGALRRALAIASHADALRRLTEVARKLGESNAPK